MSVVVLLAVGGGGEEEGAVLTVEARRPGNPMEKDDDRFSVLLFPDGAGASLGAISTASLFTFLTTSLPTLPSHRSIAPPSSPLHISSILPHSRSISSISSLNSLLVGSFDTEAKRKGSVEEAMGGRREEAEAE